MATHLAHGTSLHSHRQTTSVAYSPSARRLLCKPLLSSKVYSAPCISSPTKSFSKLAGPVHRGMQFIHCVHQLKISVLISCTFSTAVVQVSSAADAEHVEVEAKLPTKRSSLKIGIVGFGTFGQFLAKRFAAKGHRILATSRGNYAEVAKQLGVDFYSDANDFCEEHPDVSMPHGVGAFTSICL